jgi:hypothetical protein
LKQIGVVIKHAAIKQVELVHPFEADLGFLYGKRTSLNKRWFKLADN